MFKTEDLFDLTHTLAAAALKNFTYPFEAVPHIRDIILRLAFDLPAEFVMIKEGVFVHPTAKIAPTAEICSPAIIGANVEIRHCAYIRGSALIGDGCVVGNSTEIKNAILFDGVQLPHFNYAGDSILGYCVHAGAGVIFSNVRGDKRDVMVDLGDGNKYYTGFKKLGSIVGDFTEIGCNSVLNPGTVTRKNTRILPLSSIKGFV